MDTGREEWKWREQEEKENNGLRRKGKDDTGREEKDRMDTRSEEWKKQEDWKKMDARRGGKTG